MPLVYELKGEYYQVLGHAWDHEVKDFKVVYRPLYHCPASAERFEGHVLAISHFSRWEEKFHRVEISNLPPAVRSLLLPGPFWSDPLWTSAALTSPVPAGALVTRSGLGRRSHEAPLLDHILGDVHGFISAVHVRLQILGFDALARGHEMDHVCYRVETKLQYQQTLAALVPSLGKTLVTSMIGGRPISVVMLHQPIEHMGFVVRAIELPCPKPGRPYTRGLEHAEIVVCGADAGVQGNAGLVAWLESCRSERLALIDHLDAKQGALDKVINADLSATLVAAASKSGEASPKGEGVLALAVDGGPPVLCVKFHQRPLYEVVAVELESGEVEAVPDGYFN